MWKPLERKDRNAIEAINKTAKYIFNNYYIHNSTVFALRSMSKDIFGGIHFLKFSDKLYIDELHGSNLFCFNSEAIHEVFKSKKSEITDLFVTHKASIKVKDEPKEIAFKSDSDLTNKTPIKDIYESKFIYDIESCEVVVALNEEDIELLYSGSLLHVSQREFMLLVHKKMIPTVSRKDIVKVYFQEIDDQTFYAIIECGKSNGVTLYSMYRAMYL